MTALANMTPEEFERAVRAETDALAELLITKNRAYGNSALNPLRVFSRASVIEQLLVRLDDKLSRLARGENTGDVPEDTVNDLQGYLVLLRIAQKASASPSEAIRAELRSETAEHIAGAARGEMEREPQRKAGA